MSLIIKWFRCLCNSICIFTICSHINFFICNNRIFWISFINYADEFNPFIIDKSGKKLYLFNK